MQVSTNIEDHTRITAADVVAAVREHAPVTGAELVAPAPRAALAELPAGRAAARPSGARGSTTLVGAMAQTKRKRRTKHRGNAAGAIEARGRTGRKPTPEEQKKAARMTARERRAKPPSWNSAAMKAVAMAAILFLLTQTHLLGKNTNVQQGLVLAVFAMVIYTPLAYVTDRAVYNRMQRKQQQGG